MTSKIIYYIVQALRNFFEPFNGEYVIYINHEFLIYNNVLGVERLYYCIMLCAYLYDYLLFIKFKRDIYRSILQNLIIIITIILFIIYIIFFTIAVFIYVFVLFWFMFFINCVSNFVFNIISDPLFIIEIFFISKYYYFLSSFSSFLIAINWFFWLWFFIYICIVRFIYKKMKDRYK